MILDSLKNSALYASVNPRFARTFEHLLKTDFSALPNGRYEIEGEEIFMMVQECNLKNPAEASLEVHDRYIDIQLILEGRESFGWSDRTALVAPRGEMDTARDILFFDDRPSTYFTLGAGEMAILFPGDGHAPLVGDGCVRKCIVKVKV